MLASPCAPLPRWGPALAPDRIDIWRAPRARSSRDRTPASPGHAPRGLFCSARPATDQARSRREGAAVGALATGVVGRGGEAMARRRAARCGQVDQISPRWHRTRLNPRWHPATRRGVRVIAGRSHRFGLNCHFRLPCRRNGNSLIHGAVPANPVGGAGFGARRREPEKPEQTSGQACPPVVTMRPRRPCDGTPARTRLRHCSRPPERGRPCWIFSTTFCGATSSSTG